MKRAGVGLLLTLWLAAGVGLAEEGPRSRDGRIRIELFAEHPQIVTPTGMDVDERGRVWAIESNTHFRPEGYAGHPSDRLLVLFDTAGDGRADRVVTFADGFVHAMSVAVRPVWLPPVDSLQVYVATRDAVWLLEDTTGDLQADRRTRLVHLDTPGTYPHNGLAGFAFDGMGWMYFGFGENLGAKYKIVGADGTTLSGGGEGGNLYRCRPDGTKLSLWATGFWNPHASCVDAFGRLFTVDNDPDSRPPCRLLHIVEGGDYGYRFRNGRRGLHPFTSWNGEIPGTLPMVAGTGEAPSGIVAYESDGLPEEYRGDLLVTSWGDHRIDRFRLERKGASFTSRAVPLITGGQNFRPVGLATAPDGSLYCTDWVLRDYKLHGQGRIWRIAMVEEPQREVIDVRAIDSRLSFDELDKHWRSPRLDVRRLAAFAIAAKHRSAGTTWGDINSLSNEPVRQQAEWINAWSMQEAKMQKMLRELEESHDPPEIEHWRLNVQKSDDPFLLAKLFPRFSAGRASAETLLNEFRNAHPIELISDPAEAQIERLQLQCLLSARQHHPRDLRFPKLALEWDNPKFRRLAVQWVAEEGLKDLRPQVEQVLDSEPLTPDLLMATLAALSLLDGTPPAEFEKSPPAELLLPIVRDRRRSSGLRAAVLQALPASAPGLDAVLLRELVHSEDRGLRLEAVRTLQQTRFAGREDLLRPLVADDRQEAQIRAEAVVALAEGDPGRPLSAAAVQLLQQLAQGENRVLAAESLRSLRGVIADRPDDREKYSRLFVEVEVPAGDDSKQQAGAAREWNAQIDLLFGRNVDWKPGEIEAAVAAGGDAEAGRRVFFHPHSAGCFKCHTVHGRGGKAGPDLSVVARSMNRKKLAESILEPSREISPQYVGWTLVMQSGRVHTGLVVGEGPGDRIDLGTPDGRVLTVRRDEIEEWQPSATSIMPEKLHERLSPGEFRDLLAFLEGLK